MHFLSKKFIFMISVLFSICIYFAGCTNIEKRECGKTHWPTQGFEDGKEGRTSRLSMFLTKCSPFNVAVDNSAYLEGYEKGLDKFCSEDSAFSRGFQGLEPEKVCAGKLKYKTSYELGVQNFCSPEYGLKDAIEGKPANLFCGTKSKYFVGFQNGLKKFCSSENGYKMGFEGKPLSNNCNYESDKTFQEGFKNGRKAFLKKDTLRIQNNINLAEKELSLVKDKYTESLSQAYEIPSTTDDLSLQEKRTKLDVEIKLLKEKKSKLEQDIFELQKLINVNNAEIGQMN
jgi:hypothetical protein